MEKDAEGISIYGIAFRDVNHDGYMDAILKVWGVRSGGSLTMSEVIVVTMTKKDQYYFKRLYI